jgi:hypothetical protein
VVAVVMVVVRMVGMMVVGMMAQLVVLIKVIAYTVLIKECHSPPTSTGHQQFPGTERMESSLTTVV